MTIGKIFRQAERFSDAALSLLVGIVQMFQAEITSIAEKTQKISRVFPACHQENFLNACVDESLDRVIHHRLVVHRKQVLICDPRQRIEPAARSAS